jgi:dipeptidyl aminopeptidase/acylaminoacyl peptidase
MISSAVLGAAAGLGGWALLAQARVAPGRGLIDDALGRCDITATPPEATPGRLVRASFYSAHRGRTVGYMLAFPPKVRPGAKLPVCLVLHGHGASERDAFEALNYHRVLAASVAAKVPPFVLASIAGGDGYWHPRGATGAPGRQKADDPFGMLRDDFPVVLAQHGLPVDRFGVIGWSMGGFGALLAVAEAPDLFIAAAASSPALWSSYDDARSANATAFGSEEEWKRWGDLLGRSDRLRGRVRVDCGSSDAFAPTVAALGERLPDAVTLAKGCHDVAFWRSVAPAQLRFVGAALAKRT